MKSLIYQFKDPEDGKKYEITIKNPKSGLTKSQIMEAAPYMTGVVVPEGCVMSKEPFYIDIVETKVLK